jgi:hypothetical protein
MVCKKTLNYQYLERKSGLPGPNVLDTDTATCHDGQSNWHFSYPKQQPRYPSLLLHPCTPHPPNGQYFPLHAAIFTLPSSHSPWGMKRNVEREKEEVLVRLIYKKTRASTSSAFNLIVFRDTYLTFA